MDKRDLTRDIFLHAKLTCEKNTGVLKDGRNLYRSDNVVRRALSLYCHSCEGKLEKDIVVKFLSLVSSSTFTHPKTWAKRVADIYLPSQRY
jgi:hypothetical protein